MFKVAIVGSGPSGLFLTKNLLKYFQNKINIDLFEKLPSPLGLLKYGVAPDHPEVKEKFMHHFDNIFNTSSVRIFVNANIGDQLQISDLTRNYDAVALCTGMSESKRNWTGIPGCFGADEIFGWYNNNPHAKSIIHDLSKTKNLVIIGNGNVALDMARLFSKNSKLLADIAFDQQIRSALSNSSIREITVIGRRELASASFTPAELREFNLLTDFCKINVYPEINCNSDNQHLTRIQAKNIQIMRELVDKTKNLTPSKILNFKFSSPVISVSWNEDNPKKGQVIVKNNITEKYEAIGFDLLIECTGFLQAQKFDKLPQDENGKLITDNGYRVFDKIYACGWAKTGPKGNIADSMLESSNCAADIYRDLLERKVFDGEISNLPSFGFPVFKSND